MFITIALSAFALFACGKPSTENIERSENNGGDVSVETPCDLTLVKNAKRIITQLNKEFSQEIYYNGVNNEGYSFFMARAAISELSDYLIMLQNNGNSRAFDENSPYPLVYNESFSVYEIPFSTEPYLSVKFTLDSDGNAKLARIFLNDGEIFETSHDPDVNIN